MGDRDNIRICLANYRLTHVWMIYQLHLKGVETDKSEFSGTLAGTRKGEKIEKIVDMANLILDEYERFWINRPAKG